MRRKHVPMSDESIRQWRSKWGMPDTPEGLHLTKVWAEGNNTQDWFCQAFAVPAVYRAITGVMIIRSTKYSKQVYHWNIEHIKEGRAITQPHWYHYVVNWFPRRALLKWKGISADYCAEQDECLGSLPGVLDRIAPDWKESYGSVSDRQHLNQLRLVFQKALRTSHWVEYSIGRSWAGYATLDVYIDVVSDAPVAPDA
jgi:hypothetical protein